MENLKTIQDVVETSTHHLLGRLDRVKRLNRVVVEIPIDEMEALLSMLGIAVERLAQEVSK